MQQKTPSAGRDMEHLPVKSKDKEQPLETFEEKIATQRNKNNFSNNCHMLRYRIGCFHTKKGTGDKVVIL